jgi:preprotein translocase subunit YajC
MNGSMIGMIAIYAVIIALVYLFLIRPNSKKKKEEAEMRNNLEIGDEITTIGGIIGKVVSIKEETVMIETGRDGTKIRILRSAIKSIDVKAEDC